MPQAWNKHGICSFMEYASGICSFMESLRSTLLTTLVEYASSWSPYNQLYRPLSWNMLVYEVPTINFIDPSRGICWLMESLHSTLLTPLVVNGISNMHGVCMEYGWNMHGIPSKLWLSWEKAHNPENAPWRPKGPK